MRWKRVGRQVGSAALFLVALRIIFIELRQFGYRDAAHSLAAALHPMQIALAMLATAGSYAALAACDALATRAASHRLPLRRTAFASFVSSAVSNTVGFGGVAGGTLRYRLYTGWGLPPGDAARVVGFTASTFWLGFLTLGGAVLSIRPLILPRVAGPLLLLVPLMYLLVTATTHRAGIASLQLTTGVIDWTCAAAVFCALLPAGRVPLLTALAVFLGAQLAGVVSNVPAGAGVFEAAVIAALRRYVDANALVGVLLAYRAVYYLLPLSLAGALVSGQEIARRRAQLTSVGRGVARTISLFVPQLFSAILFIDGVVLLASGVTPSQSWRITMLQTTVPLAFVEVAHLVGSLSGAGLLFLARGIQRRLDGAWLLSLAMLVAGIAASLLKGLDYEEAAFLALTFALLLPCRAQFYRKTSLLEEPFTAGWITAIVLAVISSAWVGLFVYRNIAYSPSLWWHFSFGGDAPRFLRGTLAVAAAALAFSIRKLMRPAPIELPSVSEEDVQRAVAIARRQSGVPGFLLLTRDKSLLFDPAREAVLMYAVQGRSWVAMGDPAGPRVAARALAWRFFEAADRHNGWPVFYQVRSAHLPVYIELGLRLLKIGEEARVRAAGFTLSGRDRKPLRHTVRKLENDGVTFEVAVDASPHLAELRAVSDSWLDSRKTREKRFSLGAFDDDYLRRLPVAIVRRRGRVVAFANVWGDDAHEELTVDLMRHDDAAPPGVMDFLFVRLIAHAAAHGYTWFNLGHAPLSGLEARMQGPLWGRAAALGLEHGGRFYNFQGLRQYKSKFDPEWEPVFLASPAGILLPRILGDIAALISGGMRGILLR
ncbi:MAG TPA: bifunctional lysylphosphatidylglycerol flippase/synthetase MprF [Thermoanaerobaculia bacterium]|nr:bifunctional lysylphosphatidylglycerol flippase/synthetase MprF [Thermoanaerobaculia bacterium]